MLLSKRRITKALIRLRGCAGWSAPVLFANPQRQVFSCEAQFINGIFKFLRASENLDNFNVHVNIFQQLLKTADISMSDTEIVFEHDQQLIHFA